MLTTKCIINVLWNPFKTQPLMVRIGDEIHEDALSFINKQGRKHVPTLRTNLDNVSIISE